MLDRSISHMPQPGVIQAGIGSPVTRDADRSMDVFQYGTALLAFVVAVLLAVIH